MHALDTWEEPGGGGAVAAVQLARLAGDCLFLTALGEDELGHRAERELSALVLWIATANLFNRLNVTTKQVAGAWH